MTQRPFVSEPDHTSPEIVLVSDPDDAQRAREDLPGPAKPASPARIEPPPYPKVLIDEPPAEERSSRRRGRRPPERRPPERRPPGRRRLVVAVAVAVLVAAAGVAAWFVWGRSSGDSHS